MESDARPETAQDKRREDNQRMRRMFSPRQQNTGDRSVGRELTRDWQKTGVCCQW